VRGCQPVPGRVAGRHQQRERSGVGSTAGAACCVRYHRAAAPVRAALAHCGQGACKEADNTPWHQRRCGRLHQHCCAAQHRPITARQPGERSPRRRWLGTLPGYRAACTCSSLVHAGTKHCSRRLVVAMHLQNWGEPRLRLRTRGDVQQGSCCTHAAEPTAVTRPPHRRLPDSGSMLTLGTPAAAPAAPGSPVDARHRVPFPDACLPHHTPTVTPRAVWQRGARQGKDGAPRCVPCDASACMHDPCYVAHPPPAAPGWGLLTPAAGRITLQPTPLPLVHRRWRLLMPSHAAGPDPPLQPQQLQPGGCRPSCWHECLSCCPGTCST